MEYIEHHLHNEIIQKVLHNSIEDFPLFKSIPDKGKKKTKRVARLYYVENLFVGYIIFKETDYLVNINNVEIRLPLRVNRKKPRYGKLILNDFIKDKREFKITLQTDTPKLIKYYKKLGFKLINKHELEYVRTRERNPFRWLFKC